MEKILAIVVLIVVIWVAIPHVLQGEWIAPTATAPNSWESAYNNGDSVLAGNYSAPELAQADASTPAGYGIYRFDFWNKPPITGRPATTQDLKLHSPKTEFRR